MSRHTIAHIDPEYYWVIGYDRPLNEFYYQKWMSTPPNADDPDSGMVDSGPIECEWDDCRKMGMQIPDKLIAILVKEACGEAETNVCKNWRGAYVRKS